MSVKNTAGSAEFVMPEDVSLPDSRHHSNNPRHGPGPAAYTFADSHRYQQRYPTQVNMLTDHFAPSALYLARKADPQPYTALSAAAIQAHVQPTDYALRPPSYTSQQAVVDFYRACHGRYGVSVNFDPQHSSNKNGSGGNYGSTAGSGGGGGTAAAGGGVADAVVSSSPGPVLELLTLGSHARGGRGLADGKRGSSNNGNLLTAAGHAATPTSSFSTPASPADQAGDYRIAQLRRNVQHVDKQVCLYYGTKEGCRRGDQCEFLHIKR